MVDVLLGAALGFHYHCLWRDFGAQQTDFTLVGKFVGVTTALTFQLVFLVIALSAVMGMSQLIGGYFWAVWERTWYYYGLAFGWLSEAWATATQ